MNPQETSPRARADERALSAVARDLLRAGVGARMTTSLELQERLDVGSGTVQKATRHLVEIGAARLRVRGHQGTIIEALDPIRVWRAAGLPPLRIVLPPPGAIESTAIGLGVREQLSAAGIPVELDFVRGARRRAVRLDDTELPVATLVSKGAAQSLGMTDESQYSWLDFGPQSYYHANSLVRLSRRGAGRNGRKLRVAMDPDSFDHTVLTEREFGVGPRIELVDCPFVQVPRAILDGFADAGVWHRLMTTITPEHAGLVVAPLASPPGVDDEFTSALLVWRAQHGEIDSLLSTLDLKKIIARLDELVALGVDSAEVREIVPWL